jgi:hypothetical protein
MLQYMAHHDEPELTFRPSNMVLTIHSDASHNSEPRSRSRAAGLFFLGDPIFNGADDTSCIADMQGAVEALCVIVPTVCQSASESEYAATFLNAQAAEPLRQTLADLGYPQPPTPIVYDNTISGALANNKCKQRKSKAFATRYHWIRDRVEQGHFRMVWRPGKDNMADFLTKAHPVHHFRSMAPFIDTAIAPPLHSMVANHTAAHDTQPISSGSTGRKCAE